MKNKSNIHFYYKWNWIIDVITTYSQNNSSTVSEALKSFSRNGSDMKS